MTVDLGATKIGALDDHLGRFRLSVRGFPCKNRQGSKRGRLTPGPWCHPNTGSPHEFKSTLTAWTETDDINGG